MTVPQDGQPLTRRQLRDLERNGQQAASDATATPATSPPAASREQSEPQTEHHHHGQPQPDEAQTRRSRFHHDQPVDEELVVVGTSATGAVSEEEAELAEVEDTPAHPVAPVSIEQSSSNPVLAPVFQPPASRPTTPDSTFDDVVSSRGVGASNSASTTNALVLPSVPSHGDIGSALDETGEVIITGSIDLPASLSSTGASPAAGLERSDLDALVEGADRDHNGSDVAPMSASRAISTHGSPTAMVAPPKRARVNAPLVLAVIAGVLAVGVVGLLLAAFVFRIF